MPDSIDITGSGNFVANKVSNSTINASIVIGKSGEYRELKDHLDTLQKLFDRTLDTETQERFELNAKINEQKAFIESFRQDILKLAETFDKIELNTGRLQKAKAHFEQGEITEARVLLEDAEEERSDNVSRAQTKLKESQEILQNAAAEYLILAQTTALDFENTNRFKDTCRYYEQSIAACPFFDNLFYYAALLQEHNQFHLAEPYYRQILQDFKKGLSVEYYAATLSNLANLQRARNGFEGAEKAYVEALKIYRELAEKNSQAYLLNVANIVNNLAVLHRDLRNYEAAENEYAEALDVYRKLAEKNPETYLPEVAMALNNLGGLHFDRNEFETAETKYTQSLEIRRQLAKKDPQAYMPKVAMTLNNLAILHYAQNEFDKAKTEYSEVLEIYREMVKTNPQVYLPDTAMTLNNLAILHCARKEIETAEAKYVEALEMYRELAKTNPQAFMPKVAMILNNLTEIYYERNEYDKAEKITNKALEMHRELANHNPQVYLPDVAMTLNNLAALHSERNEHDEAEKKFNEALDVYEKLAETNPQTYLPDVAMISGNFALFYRRSKSDREKSVELALRAIRIILPFVESAPYTQKYFTTALGVLNEWGVSEEEMEAAITGESVDK